MSRIVELGPFVSKLNSFGDIDVDEYGDLDTIEFAIPGTADSFLHDVGAITPEITYSGGNVQVEWDLELTMRDGGVQVWALNIDRVWGSLNFDVIIPDPMGDDYQELKHEMEFSTVGKMVNNSLIPGGWEMEVNYDELSLAEGIWPSGIEINVKLKKIVVKFE